MKIHNPHYRMGDYLVRCDRTGFRRYASQARKEWQNLIVREESWETRQPQDFVRGREDNQTVPDARPGWTSATATFHSVGDITRDSYS